MEGDGDSGGDAQDQPTGSPAGKRTSALNELKRLQWEIGKLRLSWRKLIQLRLQKLALEKRVCEATKGKGLEGKEDDCLSVEEAMILSKPARRHLISTLK